MGRAQLPILQEERKHQIREKGSWEAQPRWSARVSQETDIMTGQTKPQRGYHPF